MYMINKVWNPGLYQGKFKHSRYFEGWYFKLIDKESKNIYAIIPGIAMGEKSRDAHEIQKTLKGFYCSKTTFVIAHRVSSVKNADLILVLDDGKIVERGTHGAVVCIAWAFAGNP